MKKILSIAFAAVLCTSAFAQKGWVSLFNGKDLSGWKQATGTAVYEVKGGCIVGTVAPGKINSFLVTENSYSDFVLEFEFKMDDGTNSGVQFRSHVNDNQRVMGYQYEFDPSERAWTGGIYDEQRRKWLYPLTYNPEASSAYKNEKWNKGRIEANGTTIHTYLNGVLCADLNDNVDSEGFIGLQVHSPGNHTERIGKKVYWKNIRICTENVEKAVKPVAKNKQIYQVNAVDNTLSAEQKAEGWTMLWDGESSAGWRSAKASTFPEKGWAIKDGELIVLGSDGKESRNGGDIITVDKYENFMLSVDFKITPGANSGIKYFVNPDIYNNEEGSAIGCEYQVLDDDLHPDAKLGVNGNRTLASLYDLIPAKKENAHFDKNDWNRAWVIVEGNHVEHWLNGVKVVEYDRNNQMFDALVAYSKYKKWENFGNHKSGHILLQDHGNEVHYKNIRIRILK